MKYLKTTHERKSAVITTIITVLIVLLFFVLGLKYYDPPISYGMEVNFGTSSQGEGDDTVAGDKGKLEGNPYANSYFNRSGPGGMGKGFGLNGRRLESAGKVAQECNQEGIVVVRITVNKEGDVILAEAGVKGTTNTHPCLLAPAKQTALLHKWHPDAMAPSKQVGFVVIQFKLGE